MAMPYPIVAGVRFNEIEGFVGYCFGDDGSVWSRQNRWGLMPVWRKRRLIPVDHARGRHHVVVVLVVDGKIRRCLVHRLILTAFIGPCPPGMEACHDPDRDTCNNRLENLRWDTHKANVNDSIKHGTFPRGSINGSARLTEEDIPVIRRKNADGVSMERLAIEYGVHSRTIGRIIKRLKWAHVPDLSVVGLPAGDVPT